MATGYFHVVVTCCVLLASASYLSAECPVADKLPESCKCEPVNGATQVTCINTNKDKILNHIPDSLPNDIIHLEMYGHNISTIDKVPYPHLLSLRLQNNNIKAITSDAFDELDKLRHLILSHNRLETISSKSFKSLELLEFLQLNNNSIRIVENNAFDGFYMKNLLKVNLANNSITELYSDVFLDSPVEEIDLSRNKLQVVPKLHNTRLESLILDHNKIEKILHDDMEFYSSLVTFSLHNNILKNISINAFTSNPVLEDLYLEHNNVTHIHPGTFANQTIIRNLWLSWNELSELDKDAIPWNSNLQSVRLYGNPWNCGCKMAWLYATNKQSPVFTSNFGSQNYSCGSPQDLKGKQIYAADTAAVLRCNDDIERGHVRLVMVIGVAAAVTLILLLGWFAYVLRRRRSGQYFRHSASSVYKKVTEPTFVVESSTLDFHDDDSKKLVYTDRKNRVNV